MPETMTPKTTQVSMALDDTVSGLQRINSIIDDAECYVSDSRAGIFLISFLKLRVLTKGKGMEQLLREMQEIEENLGGFMEGIVFL